MAWPKWQTYAGETQLLTVSGPYQPKPYMRGESWGPAQALQVEASQFQCILSVVLYIKWLPLKMVGFLVLCTSAANGGFWLSFYRKCSQEKKKRGMDVVKNLNIKSKHLVRKWKSKQPHFHWKHVEFPCGSPLLWLICWCSCYSHLALKHFPTFSGEGIHPTVLYGSILKWDESFLSVFTVDLKGTYATGFPWKSPWWKQVKLRGKSFTVVFAIILMRLQLHFLK